jgi:hypothetical protein
MTETTDRMPLDELAESLNGFEELAIQKAFGLTLDHLEEQGTIAVRAFAFIEFKREGQKDAAAHKAAMEMTLRELTDRYPELAEDDAANPMAGIKDDGPKA